MKDKLTMLMILDGFGDNPNKDGNAIKLAKTPNIDRLMKTYWSRKNCIPRINKNYKINRRWRIFLKPRIYICY